MKHFIYSLTAFMLSAPFSSQAASRYPTHIPNRIFGSSQDVGSCQSEAYVGAVEHELARLGVNIGVSLQHTHPYVWREETVENARKAGVLKTDATTAIINAYGGIVPDYVLPEDLEGVDTNSLVTNAIGDSDQKVRISIENLGIYAGGFDPAAIGFSMQYFSFQKGFNNSRTFVDFMNQVRAGGMLSLSFDADFLYKFDSITGLLMEPYASNNSFFDDINHAVAIVGFDDELGGVIIRNTWNDNDAQIRIDEHYKAADLNEQLQADLQKFRFKINKRILPGYYLFPYSFIEEMFNRSVGGYRVLTADLGSFANQYAQNLNRYQVIKALYTCDKQGLVRSIQGFKGNWLRYQDASLTQAQRTRAYRSMMGVIFGQIGKSRKTFHFAKQSRLTDGSVDRVQEFYQGKFAGYYCGAKYFEGLNPDPVGSFWPLKGRDAILENPQFMVLVEKISINYADLNAWLELFELLSAQENL